MGGRQLAFVVIMVAGPEPWEFRSNV